MGINFSRITDVTELEKLIDRSKQRPVVIFKHSLTCPISASAFERMKSYDGDVDLVEVQRARSLSDEIAQRLGVRHESPQIIIVRNGQVLWDASHFQITADKVAEAVRNGKTSATAEGTAGSQ
ncbi:MAG TPA: bacillithiol system redox-active protein YtxJ [Pyrinomonadaceae bacterium]|nr:bacillithiol system redox-active protein YtxJ [Pyrinomonadaceae bacterium]